MKNIVLQERTFSTYEHQIKIRADNVEEERILGLGAKKIGTVVHEDCYFVEKGKKVKDVNELVRVRKEGGEELFFTYKGPVANRKIRTRLVVNRIIKQDEFEEIKKKYDEVVCVNKKRTIYLKDGVIINYDKVDNLGTFIELDVEKDDDEPKLGYLVNKLELDISKIIKLSYFELAIAKFSIYDRIMNAIVDKFGKFSFGIASSVLTTLGIIVGLNAATSSKLAVIGGIVAVAVADSLADSIGMYSSEKSKRGVSNSSAFKAALNVFIGKVVFTLTFIVPFLMFPVSTAIIVSVIWGLLLIKFVNFQIAYVQGESIPKTIIKNVLIAIAVIMLSYIAGYLVGLLQ